MASGHVTVPHKQAEHMAAPTSSAFKSNKSLPTGGRPHMAILGSFERLSNMAVLAVKSDIRICDPGFPFYESPFSLYVSNHTCGPQ